MPLRLTTTLARSTSRPDTPVAHAAPWRWWALAVLALAQFLVVLDATIVNIALPSIARTFSLDAAAVAWTITAYVLFFGSLLLLGGRLTDRFGHRRPSYWSRFRYWFAVTTAPPGTTADSTSPVRH